MRRNHSQRELVFSQMLRNPVKRKSCRQSCRQPKAKYRVKRPSGSFLRFGSLTELLVHIPECFTQDHKEPHYATPQKVELPSIAFKSSALSISPFALHEAGHLPTKISEGPRPYASPSDRVRTIKSELFNKHLTVEPAGLHKEIYLGPGALEFIKQVKSGEFILVYFALKSTPELANSVDITGNSALHYSVKCANLNITDLLILNSANPNLKNRRGRSPLFYATRQDSLEMSRLLVRAGASLDIDEHLWRGPIEMAVTNSLTGLFSDELA